MGYFVELLNFRVIAKDAVLKNLLASAAKNATYISAPTQNQLIKCCGDAITDKLVKEIKAAKFYTILADKVSDCSNKEHMSIVIRYVDSACNIQESFVRFVDLEGKLNGKHLSSSILHCIQNDLKLDIMDCRGQGYDGAGAMARHINGCSAHILIINKKALYTHCYSHRLDLVMQKSCSDQAIRNFLGHVQDMTIFLTIL